MEAKAAETEMTTRRRAIEEEIAKSLAGPGGLGRLIHNERWRLQNQRQAGVYTQG